MVAQALSGTDDGAPVTQLVGAQVEAHLLSEFSHGRSARRFAGIATTSRQGIAPALPVADQQEAPVVPDGHLGALAQGP
jgi:adenine/guanine phosphoribosyltransferase-like PRPP-binding protein